MKQVMGKRSKLCAVVFNVCLESSYGSIVNCISAKTGKQSLKVDRHVQDNADTTAQRGKKLMPLVDLK